jgi:hypothetical protein
LSHRQLTDEEWERQRQHWERALKVPVQTRKIRAIEVVSVYHWQPKLYIEVGKPCADLWKDTPPELVLAIFESRSFLVCTPDHGIERGAPHIFTRDDVRKVILWDQSA